MAHFAKVQKRKNILGKTQLLLFYYYIMCKHLHVSLNFNLSPLFNKCYLPLLQKLDSTLKSCKTTLCCTQKGFGFALVAFSFGVYLSKNVCIKDRNSWLMDLMDGHTLIKTKFCPYSTERTLKK